MSQSLCRLYVYVIFSTKHRAPWITSKLNVELCSYMGAVLKQVKCDPIMINAVEDHIHALCVQSKDIDIIKLLMHMKTRTTPWVKRKGVTDFHWQNGYGAFSVSPSRLDATIRYIRNQQEHHKRESFQDEFRRFLKEYKIPYDERFLWDQARSFRARSLLSMRPQGSASLHPGLR